MIDTPHPLDARQLVDDFLRSRTIPKRPTVAQVIAAHRDYARAYYRKHGEPTGEAENIDAGAALVEWLFGAEPAEDFGPLKLKAVQSIMATGYEGRDGRAVKGLCLNVVNARVSRIRRVFRWAESEQLVPASLSHALATVPPLMSGRGAARETPEVEPVSDEIVAATLPWLPRVVADMVQLERRSGARPTEVCILRPCDVEQLGDVWVYHPDRFKTEHFGHRRKIYLGPICQAVLAPYLERPAEAYCFSPRESMQLRWQAQRAARKTPVQPSQVSRAKPAAARLPGECYTHTSYGRAIARACKRHGIPHWHPNQLRHAAATAVREAMGIEAARPVLGHSRLDTTQIYAREDEQVARTVALKMG